MRAVFMSLLAVAVAAIGCGGSSAPPESPDETARGVEPAGAGASEPDEQAGKTAEPAAEAAGAALPTKCADAGAEYCMPSQAFAKRLCEGDFPSVALHMFSGNVPFTKAYLGRKTKAWSASGAGSSNEELPRDEEVVVLMHRGPPDLGGIEVSGATGGYEVLRWNGGCVTLQAGELLFDSPPKPQIARIVWKRLEMETRDALREDSAVNDAYLQHRKHCKGVSMGTVSLECVKADAALGEAVARHVRSGGKLPTPSKLP